MSDEWDRANRDFARLVREHVRPSGPARSIEVWTRGYVSPGEDMRHGTVEASSLRKACAVLAVRDWRFAKDYDSESLTLAGFPLSDGRPSASVASSLSARIEGR